MGSEVLSPTHVRKSHLLSLKKTLKYGSNPFKSDLGYFVQTNSWDLSWELSLAFCSTQLSTQVLSLTSPCLQKVLPCRHPCHTWDWGFETPCEPTLSIKVILKKEMNAILLVGARYNIYHEQHHPTRNAQHMNMWRFDVLFASVSTLIIVCATIWSYTIL